VNNHIRGFALSIILFTGSLACAGAVRVVNAGMPGENSTEVDSRLDAALQQTKPQYIVLFVGMNDAVNDRKFLPLETTAAKVSSMVKRSQAAGAKVIVVSVHEPDTARLLQRHKPEVYGSMPPAERIRALDRALKQVADSAQAGFVDFHDTLIKAGGANLELSTDGVHLTARGYALLAESVRKGLPAQIDNTTTILCMGDSLTYGIGVRQPGGAPEGDRTYPAQLQALLQQDSHRSQ
jgi:acyl-CoA thioesterase-1